MVLLDDNDGLLPSCADMVDDTHDDDDALGKVGYKL